MMRSGRQYAAEKLAACTPLSWGHEPARYMRRECTRAAATCTRASAGTFFLFRNVFAKEAVTTAAAERRADRVRAIPHGAHDGLGSVALGARADADLQVGQRRDEDERRSKTLR